MLRKLFALLLLLTGLAALSQPVHARTFEAESARTTAMTNLATAAQPGIGAARLQGPHDLVEARPGIAVPPLAAALPAPTVRLQADRARE